MCGLFTLTLGNWIKNERIQRVEDETGFGIADDGSSVRGN